MRRLCAFLLFLSFHSYAQDSTKVEENVMASKGDSWARFAEGEMGSESMVRFDLNVFANSSAITNSFTNAYAFSDFITNEKKDDVTAKLKDNNRFGMDVNGGLALTLGKLHKQDDEVAVGYYKHFEIRNRDFASIDFHKNFFELYFRGNKQFAGQSVDIPVNFTYFNYQQFSFGYSKKDFLSNTTYGAKLSLYKGSRFQQAKIEDASLFTASLGDSIHFASDFSYQYADGDKSRLANIAGVGAGIDLFFYKKINNKHWITVSASDIGFINWNDLNTFKANSSWSFTGVQIDDVLNIDGNEFSNIQADSVSQVLGIENNLQNKTYLLPGKLYFSYSNPTMLGTNIFTRLSVSYIYNTAYIPRISMYNSWNILKKRTYLRTNLSYGGFSKMDVSLGFGTSIGKFEKALHIVADLFLVEQILASKTTGAGLNFVVFKYF